MKEAQALPTEALTALANLAAAADVETVWPTASWEALRRSGVLAASIPKQYGGQGRDALELLSVYEQLAGACLTTAFILSQREGAVRRLLDSGNKAACDELLPQLARDECFLTIGLSQLTTSRQHGAPAVTAREAGDNLIVDGVIPWVTGAAEADFVVGGAVLEDGRQVLALVRRETKGVRVGAPLGLMALRDSLTTEVTCNGVVVPRSRILAGPAEKVMNMGRGGTGGLETSCLALGLAGAATQHLFRESAGRPELNALAERLEETRQGLRQEMHAMAKSANPAEKAASLRGRCNALVLQATQVALTASKGTGFLRSHPAQRWARQAMFFLVWSCPRPATEATLAFLTPGDEHVQFCH